MDARTNPTAHPSPPPGTSREARARRLVTLAASPAALALAAGVAVAGGLLAVDRGDHDALRVERLTVGAAVPVLDGRGDDPAWAEARPSRS